MLVELWSPILSFKQSFEQSFRLKGETPLDPPAHCVLYSLRGQSSCRGFGRAFGRPFVELCMEVRVELLQSFGRASCRALVEFRVEHYAEPYAGVRLGD